MQVFDSSNTSLGTASITGTALATACAGDILSSAAVGPGLLDLSSSCIQVTAGERLTYTLSLSGGTVATGDQNSYRCSNGGNNFCFEDFDCQQYVGIDVAPTFSGGG